jgi:hypothetical protein
MMLFLAIAATLAFVVVFLLILFANGMSDAPSSPGLSFLPAWIILAVAALGLLVLRLASELVT